VRQFQSTGPEGLRPEVPWPPTGDIEAMLLRRQSVKEVDIEIRLPPRNRVPGFFDAGASALPDVVLVCLWPRENEKEISNDFV
jgi:hypothetical protein